MYVFVHIDADPDPSSFSTCRTKVPARRGANQKPEVSKWNGLLTTIRFLEKLTEKLEKIGLSFKSTFFLRADEQIKSFYGSYSEIFRMFHDKVQQSFGIGWHPHLYRWSQKYQCWCQEYHDDEWMSEVLINCHENIRSQGFRVQFSKMGWCFHNDTTMKTLSDLGINADFSALPGAKSPGYRECGLSFQNRFDWSRTDPRPYHPSKEDYQRPGDLQILEVPLTTYRLSGPLVFLYTLKLALKSYKRLDFSYFPSSGIMIPPSLPELAKRLNLEEICEHLLRHKENDYITMYFHPHDFLDIRKQDIFENVVLRMVSVADKHEIKISFVDASKLYSYSRLQVDK